MNFYIKNEDKARLRLLLLFGVRRYKILMKAARVTCTESFIIFRYSIAIATLLLHARAVGQVNWIIRRRR